MPVPKRFSASSAAQLMSCPGSANLELAIKGYVEPVRDDAAGAKGVGTVLHAFMDTHFTPTKPTVLRDYALCLRYFAQLYVGIRRDLCDDENKRLLWIDQMGVALELLDQINDWLPELREYPPKTLRFLADTAEYMADLLERTAPHATVYGEQSVVATWLPSTPPTTPDVAIVGDYTLEIVDYKTGAIKVEPEDNDQLMFYAACWLKMAPHATEFTVHVLQPGNLASWTAPISYLKGWMKKAIAADKRIQAKDLTLNPSDHCTFCPANPWGRGDKSEAKCPAQHKLLYPPVYDEDELFADN
jgi:uncharacterized protein DUF2800